MGMFDRYENFEDHFKVGDRFTLEGAKLGAILTTPFGDAQQVLFKIDGKVYSALGAGFVAQVARAEAGDFPVDVEYVTDPPKKAGNSPTKLLWPVNVPRQSATPTPATPRDDSIPF